MLGAGSSLLDLNFDLLLEMGLRIGRHGGTWRQLVRFTIITFADFPKVLISEATLTSEGLPPFRAEPKGQTHFARAFLKVKELIETDYKDANKSNKRNPLVCVLTDGEPKGESPEALRTAQMEFKSLKGIQEPEVLICCLPPGEAKYLVPFLPEGNSMAIDVNGIHTAKSSDSVERQTEDWELINARFTKQLYAIIEYATRPPGLADYPLIEQTKALLNESRRS